MKKRLIIVYDEEVKEYVEYLKTLFSCFDDINSSIQCVSYRVKEYQPNEVEITTRENILFLGNSEEIRKYYKLMEPNIIYKYGMRYGSKGRRSFMYVEKDKITTKKEYKNFIEYCKKVDEELKSIKAICFTKENIFDNKIVKGGMAVVGDIFIGLPTLLVAGKFLYDWYDDKKNREKIKEQQYQCLCCIVCKEIVQKLEKEAKEVKDEWGL